MYLCRRQNLTKKKFHCPLKFYLSLSPLPPLPLRFSVFFNFPFFTFFPRPFQLNYAFLGIFLNLSPPPPPPPPGWVNSLLLHVSREFCFVKLICRNLYALFSHVRNAYTANQNGVAVFTWKYNRVNVFEPIRVVHRLHSNGFPDLAAF